MKQAILLFIAAITLNQATYALSCKEGFSVGYLANAYNQSNSINTEVIEFQGNSLWYVLQLDLSSAKTPDQVSASNSLNMTISVKADDKNAPNLSKLAQSIQTKKVAALCVQSDLKALPAELNLQLGQSLEIDPAQPIAK